MTRLPSIGIDLIVSTEDFYLDFHLMVSCSLNMGAGRWPVGFDEGYVDVLGLKSEWFA